MADGVEHGAGVLAPGPLLPLRALAWMLALFVVLAILAGLETEGRMVLGLRWSPFGPAGALVGAGLACAAYVGLVRRFERRWPEELALKAAAGELAYGLALGAGLFALVFFGLERLGAESLVRSGPIHWRAALASNLATGVVEELLFRAVVFRLLMAVSGPWWALVASAVLFGAAHFLSPHADLMAAAAIAVEAGLMLAALYLATGRLWMSIGAHAAWNFTEGRVFGAAVSGGGAHESLFLAQPNPQAPTLLTGGAFGPEASVAAMIAGFATAAVALWAWRRRTARSAIGEADARPLA